MSASLYFTRVEEIQGDCRLKWPKCQQAPLRDLTYHQDESTLGVKMSRSRIHKKYILDMGLELCCILVSFLSPIVPLLSDKSQIIHQTKWASSLHGLGNAAPSDGEVLDHCLPPITREQEEFPNDKSPRKLSHLTFPPVAPSYCRDRISYSSLLLPFSCCAPTRRRKLRCGSEAVNGGRDRGRLDETRGVGEEAADADAARARGEPE